MAIKMQRQRGFTILELLVVVGIIALLLGILILTLSKLRNQTKIQHTKLLISQMHDAMEAYHLSMREYPPDKINGLTESQALAYFLTTAFRKTPDLSKGEVLSDTNMGPLMSFDPVDLGLPETGGFKSVVDTWGMPLRYRLVGKVTASMNTQMKSSTIMTPLLYSTGPNKLDETTSNTKPSDDIMVGDQ